MTTPATFGTRLRAALDARGPFCVGIDPHPGLLAQWGLPDDASGLERFALTATEAVAGVAAVIKPQSAFFERHGSAGIAVLEKVLATGREAGAVVLLDVKRGDIGSTSQAYADAYLDPASPLYADAVTVSPFLGFGSLDPFVEAARKHDGGLFVLALTSNPEAPEVQSARTATGTVAGDVLRRLRRLNEGDLAADAADLGSFGAVVGATIGDTAEDLDVRGPLLVPGVGAQGGNAESVRRTFGAAVRNVVPSSSREVLGAGPDPTALRDAAERSIEGFRAIVGA